MRFSENYACSGNQCPYYILAEGTIEPESPVAFSQFLRSVKYHPAVYFNSPGGNLAAAIKIGRMIRQQGFDTFVGGNYTKSVTPDRDILLVEQGLCLSACAYAFMGGVGRGYDAASGVIGLHQFYSDNRAFGEATAQAIMSQLAGYSDEMGVARQILDLASTTVRGIFISCRKRWLKN